MGSACSAVDGGADGPARTVAEDDTVYVASRSRWAAAPAWARPRGRCKVAVLLPLPPAQVERVRQCGGPDVLEVVELSPLAHRLLRNNAFKPGGPPAYWPDAPAPAAVAAAVAEIDAALDGAHVWFGAWWGTVEGSAALGATRFPPALRWVCISQAGSAHVPKWLADEQA